MCSICWMLTVLQMNTHAIKRKCSIVLSSQREHSPDPRHCAVLTTKDRTLSIAFLFTISSSSFEWFCCCQARFFPFLIFFLTSAPQHRLGSSISFLHSKYFLALSVKILLLIYFSHRIEYVISNDTTTKTVLFVQRTPLYNVQQQ